MRAALSAAALLLAACASERPAEPLSQRAEEATDADACGVSHYAHLIGTPAAEIDRKRLPEHARIITPDVVVTMDFSATRLNIMVGTDGRVGSLRCF